ncbi:T9SS sorting signal type C domain-containing protein [Flavobacterium sp.]|uniref:T9SS sorting signal type C domain-containing protein n=1 Tax=Flavobacterium sp. TaxID=239 RepID=UPI0035295F36
MKKITFLFVFCLIFVTNKNNAQQQIAAWTFDNLAASPDTPTVIASDLGTGTIYADGTNGSSIWASSASNTQITSFAGTTNNDPRTPAVSGKALALANDTANGNAIIITFSTLGLYNPIISFATRGTSTGFSTHIWEWSTDGSTFTTISVANTAVNSSTWSVKTIDLTDINAVDNQTNVYIRLTVSGASSSSGNNRLDNIVVNVDAPSCSVTHTWDGSSWSPSAPVADQKAVIAGNYTGAGFEACSLDVASGTVVFDSGTLVIDGVITVDAAASVTLENDINLVQNQDVANVGNITVKRNSQPMLWLDYTYWSSPVSGQNLMAFSPNTLWQRFYSYNESAGAWANADPVNNSFAEGTGYSIRADNTQQATPTVAVVHNGQFTGVPFNGDVSVPVTVGSGGGFNLLGNPYASTIDADTFLTDNAATGISTLYFWTHQNQSNQATGGTYDQNNYASYTLAGGAGTTTADNSSVVPNGEIQIGQGFFVEATTAGNAVFNNAQRMNTNSGQFFKTTNTVERNRIWLNFGNGSLNHNQMMVAYMTGATLGVDTAIDGKLLSTAASNLYSLIDNATAEYVIQGRSLPFDDNDEVALGFVAATAGNYTIALDHVDGLFTDQAIYLWDKQLNVIHDIKTSAYTFTSGEGQFDARFSLVYKNNLKAETAVVTADAIVYVQNHQIMISTGNQLLKSVTVYDIQGRKLFSQANINTSEFAVEKVNATNQVVLVEIETENGKTTKKVKL